jgi:hypothetical protein
LARTVCGQEHAAASPVMICGGALDSLPNGKTMPHALSETLPLLRPISVASLGFACKAHSPSFTATALPCSPAFVVALHIAFICSSAPVPPVQREYGLASRSDGNSGFRKLFSLNVLANDRGVQLCQFWIGAHLCALIPTNGAVNARGICLPPGCDSIVEATPHNRVPRGHIAIFLTICTPKGTISY